MQPFVDKKGNPIQVGDRLIPSHVQVGVEWLEVKAITDSGLTAVAICYTEDKVTGDGHYYHGDIYSFSREEVLRDMVV